MGHHCVNSSVSQLVLPPSVLCAGQIFTANSILYLQLVVGLGGSRVGRVWMCDGDRHPPSVQQKMSINGL